MALEIRRGTVSRLSSSKVSRGRAGWVSVAEFQLNGSPVRYNVCSIRHDADPVLPLFEDGELLVVAGKTGPSGVFLAQVSFVPRLQKVIGEGPGFLWVGLFALIFFLQMFAMLLVALKDTKQLAVIGVLGPAATFLGLAAYLYLRRGFENVIARRLLRRHSRS